MLGKMVEFILLLWRTGSMSNNNHDAAKQIRLLISDSAWELIEILSIIYCVGRSYKGYAIDVGSVEFYVREFVEQHIIDNADGLTVNSITGIDIWLYAISAARDKTRQRTAMTL